MVPDGMSDYPLSELGNRTPMEASKIPNMNFIAKFGIVGTACTIPKGMTPASDVANLAILGYDPKKYYSGRGPLEAANMGVDLDRGFYFLHSYYFDATDAASVIATVECGVELPCGVTRGNVFGLQFHPEKSHANGVAVFRNFATL